VVGGTTCRARSFYISFAKITMRKRVPITFTSTQGVQLLKYQLFSGSTRKWILASDLYGKMEGTAVSLPDFPVFWHALRHRMADCLGDAIKKSRNTRVLACWSGAPKTLPQIGGSKL